jgi:hypothetical protein
LNYYVAFKIPLFFVKSILPYKKAFSTIKSQDYI